MQTYDEDDELGDDADESDTEDLGNDDDHLMPCPYCRQMIYDDAERCPECGKYVSEEDAPRHKPPWFLITAILCILSIFILWIVFRY